MKTSLPETAFGAVCRPSSGISHQPPDYSFSHSPIHLGCPGGTGDNSPPFERWDRDVWFAWSPSGTTETHHPPSKRTGNAEKLLSGEVSAPSFSFSTGFSRFPSPNSAPFAFTLVELLVVVAIIAILAGIALPNFLEAQTRSKVSRVKSDLRTLATALESYHGDYNRYPPSILVPRFARLRPLTTPIAYLSSVPLDVFQTVDSGAGPFRSRGNYAYGARPIEQESRWALASDGPDLTPNHQPIEFYPGWSDDIWENPASGFDYIRYDPTNGTISVGDIWRVSDHQMP